MAMSLTLTAFCIGYIDLSQCCVMYANWFWFAYNPTTEYCLSFERTQFCYTTNLIDHGQTRPSLPRKGCTPQSDWSTRLSIHSWKHPALLVELNWPQQPLVTQQTYMCILSLAIPLLLYFSSLVTILKVLCIGSFTNPHSCFGWQSIQSFCGWTHPYPAQHSNISHFTT